MSEKAGGGNPYAGMSYEEILANPPTYEDVRRKRPLALAKPKPKAVFVEVSPRMHAAVKARPEKLRLIAEDSNGNAVFEKPAASGRARTGVLRESDVGTEAYERLRVQPGVSRPQPGSGSPPDQFWKSKQGWDGLERFVPDRGGRSNVTSDYDIFAVLKETER